MNRPLLFLCALLPLLAGCTGYPPGTVRSGDRVTIQYDAYDLQTGALLAQGTLLNVTVGDREAPLGFDLDHALRGKTEGDVFRVESTDDLGRMRGSLVAVPKDLERYDRNGTLPLSLFLNPDNVTVGLPFTDPDSRLQARVTAIQGGNVAFQRLPGSPQGVEEVGLALTTPVVGGSILLRVEPLVDRPVFQGPLGDFLPQPGNYWVLGSVGGNLTLMHRTGTNASAPALNLALEVTVVDVLHGASPAGPNPQLARDPRRPEDMAGLRLSAGNATSHDRNE